MNRAQLTLKTPFDRQKAAHWIDRAPVGTRVEFKGFKRSLDQNSRLWAMLSDIAKQKELNGKKYTTNQWKIIFMHACGQEVQFLPSLDGSTFIPAGHSSSDLSRKEMADLITFMLSWGDENGVEFHDPESIALRDGSQA